MSLLRIRSRLRRENATCYPSGTPPANKPGNPFGSSSWRRPPRPDCRRSYVATATLTPTQWLPSRSTVSPCSISPHPLPHFLRFLVPIYFSCPLHPCNQLLPKV
ncbi:hypothetical protein BV378_35785 [Nostoc sp. RF31YmG]|nr:hypothetical protein BV378_35785 [Nostoc sp. RF31YmG]